MREWIIVANRAEAKIFERDNKGQDLRWIKTFINKKGRRKERDFQTDKPGSSYAKYAAAYVPHNLEGKHSHAEIVANHFAQVLGKFIKTAHDEKLFKKATIFAGPKFLGKIKDEVSSKVKDGSLCFVDKNIEKSDSEQIKNFVNSR